MPPENKQMKIPRARFLTYQKMIFIRSFIILVLSSMTLRLKPCFSRSFCSLKTVHLVGHFEFYEVDHASRDFGNSYQFPPLAVLYPKSVADISTTIRHIWEMGPRTELTVAARGHGHSLQGQAQAHRGVVINMETLKDPIMQVYTGAFPYIDVSGGESWINILQESLKYSLAPKSWTDYLHLTVGGTLSNAGISGQAFRHGPQISNVQQLEVVTGKGEVLNCSEKHNSDLFHAVLGGLGQFGIITRARISLEPAPRMVKWIRVLYLDFKAFTLDQERLVSADNMFDYLEGFVIINRTGLLNNWRSSFNPQNPIQAALFKSEGRTLYCLELAKYFNLDNRDTVDQEVDGLLSQMSYISSTLFLSEVSYEEFLDRVRVSEIMLRSKGLWDVPHPWLNLLIPKSKIHTFAEVVFRNILTETSHGPILIYPLQNSKWDNRTSIVIPEEDIFYVASFLSSAVPSSAGNEDLEHILTRNERILEFCDTAHLGVKQYLPHYTAKQEWRAHFGPRWEVFVKRKLTYDPLAILAPGQRIFQKAVVHS